jgi:STE24 endopeptidase
VTSTGFTNLFVFALIVSVAIKLWLSTRQSRHVALNRPKVPAAFSSRIGIDAHHRAADYTLARLRLGIVDLFIGTLFLVALTLLGGLQWFESVLVAALPESPFVRQLLLVVGVVVAGSLIDLPIAWYRQFRLEARFGFNRMTPKLFIVDLVKGALIGAALGVPLLAVVLWLMMRAGEHWWFWTWLVWVGFNLFVLVLYPTVIAPLFNKFEPLADETVRQRVEQLLARCGFATKGLFVMDGSRRSSHGNAYFTGLGKAKRIVFFDTLLARLNPTEIEAVLAHELGHFKHRHVLKRIVFTFVGSLIGLWLLGYLSQQTWFYRGLGITPDPADWAGVALILFFLVMPVFMLLLQPVFSHLSRRHEFQADAFAAENTRPQDLVSALVKLYEDNAATLTPDPIHSAFYDSHPPAAQRVGRLTALIVSPQTQ